MIFSMVVLLFKNQNGKTPGHCDHKMGDSSTPYDQFISVYMPLLTQKYPDMKKLKVY